MSAPIADVHSVAHNPSADAAVAADVAAAGAVAVAVVHLHSGSSVVVPEVVVLVVGVEAQIPMTCAGESAMYHTLHSSSGDLLVQMMSG